MRVSENWASKAYVDARLSYGVEWDESADSYTRTGRLAGIAVGSSPGGFALPIRAKMRRCILYVLHWAIHHLSEVNNEGQRKLGI
jgi:hypothetical protein